VNKRPLSVTIVGLLQIAVGTTGFAFHLNEIKLQHAFQGGNVWIFVIESVAIVGGTLLLRGNDWGRWVTLAWITFHVVFSFFDSLGKVAGHAMILVLFAYVLFRPEANTFFRWHKRMGSA
jgi:hypothetical protein